MPKYLILLAGASALAFSFPSVFERYKAQLVEEETVDQAPPVVEVVAPVATPTYSGRVAQLAVGSDGHFRAEARLNGRVVEVLVDTGATYISMNEATARRLGIHLRNDAYRFKAQTANGETAVAIATLDRVQIGQVEVRDVEALVSRGDGLPTTLLGMSFLGKLKRFEVQNDRLNLIQ